MVLVTGFSTSTSVPPSSPAGDSAGRAVSWLQDHLPLIIDYSVKIIGVLAILFVAWIIAAIVARWVLRAMNRAQIDLTLARFASKVSRWAILLFAVLGCLGVFGVDVTSFAAAIAAVGFAIGMALQGSLSHLAAGVMLLVFRPFKVGDTVVISGQTGKVFELDLFSTSLDTPDNRRIIVPNGSIFGSVIENTSYHARRRADVAVGTDYGADLDDVRAILQAAGESIEQRLPSEDVQVVLTELGASSINWSVRVWVAASDYWPVKDALARTVKQHLDQAGIGIPFPQMDIHLDHSGAPTA